MYYVVYFIVLPGSSARRIMMLAAACRLLQLANDGFCLYFQQVDVQYKPNDATADLLLVFVERMPLCIVTVFRLRMSSIPCPESGKEPWRSWPMVSASVF